MAQAFVRIGPVGGPVTLVPAGGIVGRMATAALSIDQPTISEAHALVSLRGPILWLLSLRGQVEIEGRVVREVPLRAGQELRLSADVVLRVEEVFVPELLLGIRVARGAVQLLQGEVMSVVSTPAPKLVPRLDETAPIRLWSNATGWRVMALGGAAEDVEPGLSLRVEGLEVDFVSVRPGEAGLVRTRADGLRPALVVRSALEELQVRSVGREVVITGVPARIVRNLVEYQEPVEWVLVAREVFGDEPSPTQLRQRWDRSLKTLRQKLDEAGLAPGLVRSDGHGNVSFGKEPNDSIQVI